MLKYGGCGSRYFGGLRFGEFSRGNWMAVSALKGSRPEIRGPSGGLPPRLLTKLLGEGTPPGGPPPVEDSYLVDSASSHMLVSKIKPCMSKYKQLYGETANGSLNQLSFI